MCQINYIIDSLSPSAFPVRRFWDLLIQMAELLYQNSRPSPLNSGTPSVLWDSNSENPAMQEDMRLVVSALEKLGPRVKSIQSRGNNIQVSLSGDSTSTSVNTPEIDQAENLNRVSETSTDKQCFGNNQDILNNPRKSTVSNISWDIPSSRLQDKSCLEHARRSLTHSSPEFCEEGCSSDISPIDLTINSPFREETDEMLYEESEISVLEPLATDRLLNETLALQGSSPNVTNDVTNLMDLSKQPPIISDKTPSILTFSTSESITYPALRITRSVSTKVSPAHSVFAVPETISSPRRISDKVVPSHPFYFGEEISRQAQQIATNIATENLSLTSNESSILGRNEKYAAIDVHNTECNPPTPSRPIRYSSPFIANPQSVVTEPSVSTRSGRTRKVKRCSCCSPDIFSQNANLGEGGGPANKRNKGRNNLFLIM